MPVLIRDLRGEEAELAARTRDDVVVEATAGDGRFTAVAGPFSEYERRIEPSAEGCVETIDYRLAPMVWTFPFHGLYRKALLQRRPDGAKPWWSPPQTPDARGATSIGSLCSLAVVFGYIGSVLTQTITFAADELGASKADQGLTLAAVRIGVLGALALSALADRQGRRRLLLICAWTGVAITALTALAPSLVALGVAQALVRGVATAGGLLLGIVAAEEMPGVRKTLYAAGFTYLAGALYAVAELLRYLSILGVFGGSEE
jgi:hypothetical protein